MKTLTQDLLKHVLLKRSADVHKGSFGHGLLCAGESGKMGAAAISARACLRSGIGLLSVCVPKDERAIVQVSVPEAMVRFRDDEHLHVSNFDAIAIGPGFGTGKNSQDWLKRVLAVKNRLLILDADALNIIAHTHNLLHVVGDHCILTPHSKEFDRLFGEFSTVEERIAEAVKQAKILKCIVVLKGHHTHIITPTEIFVNTTGNAGLAKGGSGDALTGMLLAFAAQGYSAENAAILAVYFHGLAADLSLEKQSLESMLISDVIENIGKAFKTVY